MRLSTDSERNRFVALVGTVLTRYARENGLPACSEANLAMIGARLWQLIEEHGLPPPLAPTDPGECHEMPAEIVAPLVARLLDGLPRAETLATPARQLVKACLQPEFRQCRDSYREVEPDGRCRRQQLKKARDRVSGTHCVDCPYWLSLTPEQHEKFLARAWHGDPAEFAAHRDVYLPEDYRQLRQWVRAVAAASSR